MGRSAPTVAAEMLAGWLPCRVAGPVVVVAIPVVVGATVVVVSAALVVVGPVVGARVVVVGAMLVVVTSVVVGAAVVDLVGWFFRLMRVRGTGPLPCT
jgi:hypothetical protein